MKDPSMDPTASPLFYFILQACFCDEGGRIWIVRALIHAGLWGFILAAVFG